MFDMTPCDTECPACGKHFTPARTNQQYCSRLCQKKATRHAARGFRHLENFARDELEATRARDLREMLYSAPPYERLGIMKDILDATHHDGGLRNILTRPELLSDKPFSAGRGRMNIAKAADAYCKKFLQMSVRSYIRHVRNGETLDLHIEPQHDMENKGPVPLLRPKLTSKNVKCIHKALPEGNAADTGNDFERVSRIVEEVQSRLDRLHPSSVPSGDTPQISCGVDEDASGAADKRSAKHKIALSRACFDKGVSIDSHMGKTIASSMGISNL